MLKLLTRKRILILLPVIFLPLLGYLAYILFIQKYYVVAALAAGHEREIRVLAETFGDNGQAFIYEVEENKEIMVPGCFIGGGGDDDGTMVFKLLYSKDRNLVGVIEESTPNILYALHDFASDEAWPGCDRFSEKGSETGLRLRDKLQAETMNYNLVLSDDVPPSVPRRLF